MGLMLPPWSWQFGVNNYTGTPSSTGVVGTSVTAGATNADGSAVTLLSALAQDAHYVVVGASGFASSGFDANTLLDILYDPAGGTSWSALINDLTVGFTASTGTGAGLSLIYHFPLYVPAGASIGARARNAGVGATGRVSIWVFGNPSRPDAWWCGQKVESLGINAAASKGTDVVPGASAGTYGSWTTIGTSTARYGSVQMGINGTDATAAAISYYFQLGIDSVQLPGSPTVFALVTTAETGQKSGLAMPIWCDQPEGTVWQMRAAPHTTSPETWNCAVYGVY